MRKELQKIEIIEKYLLGLLDAEATTEFENEMDRNNELKEKVNLQESLLEGLERIGLKKDMLNAKKIIHRKKIMKWLLMLVALISLMYLGFVSIFNSKPSAHYNHNIKLEQFAVDSSAHLTILGKDSMLKKQTTFDSVDVPRKEISQPTGNNKTIKLKTVNLPVKAFQIFKIDPTKENIIAGKEGTIINFEDDCFNTESDDIITIKLKEFYKMSDIVFANLTTQTTDYKMLETGGMIYVEAYNKTQNKLNLNPDKPIRVKFPVQRKKSNMKTFLGKINDVGNVEWEEDLRIEEVEFNEISLPLEMESPQVFTIVENMPYFETCTNSTNKKEQDECTQQEFVNRIQQNIRIPKNTIKRNVNSTVYLTFMVNEVGVITSVKSLRKTNPLLESLAMEALYKISSLNPGKQRGKTVRVQYTIPFKFKIEASDDYSEELYALALKNSQQNIATTIENHKKALLNGLTSDSVLSDHGFEKNQLLNLDYYLLSSSRLNWINCDRFYSAKNQRTTFAVNESHKTAEVKIIFKSFSSILVGKRNLNKFSFPRVPANTEIYVYATKLVDGELQLAFQTANTSNSQPKLQFEPLTKENLDEVSALLEALD